MLQCTALLYRTAQHSTALHCTILHCIVLPCTALLCSARQRTARNLRTECLGVEVFANGTDPGFQRLSLKKLPVQMLLCHGTIKRLVNCCLMPRIYVCTWYVLEYIQEIKSAWHVQKRRNKTLYAFETGWRPGQPCSEGLLHTPVPSASLSHTVVSPCNW